MAYNVTRLYQETFSIPYEWEKFLPREIYEYHDLLYKEFNGPVSLQMGVLLPFISSLAGPKVRGLWGTRENVINFFTINIAASGVGKSSCRKHLISEPIRYVLDNGSSSCQFPDMEINKYTRAGIEDHLIANKGYCIVVSDEASGFLKDLKNKENKNESDITLLNQLYDGEGDKQTLAQNRQRKIPNNSTGIAMSLQQEAFVNGIVNLGYQNWVDSGFSERFMVTAVKPFRHFPKENEDAHAKLMATYDENIMGKIALSIFEHHYNNPTTYRLGLDAKETYDEIVETYNEQFNMKWCSQDGKDGCDSDEKSEIPTRSKAPTLIGRLSVILWIYFNAFDCVHNKKKFDIPLEISGDCVKFAEQIIKTSYAHHENFCTAVFNTSLGSSTTVSKPRKTSTMKVLSAVIRSEGCFLNVQKIVKNLKPLSTKIVKAELKALENDGFGKLVTREEMQEDIDRGFPKKDCISAFFKPSPTNIDSTIFKRARDSDLNETFYLTQFRKPTDEKMYSIVLRYHPHIEDLTSSQRGSFSEDKENDPKDFQELDGVLKTDLFTKKKKESVKVSTAAISFPSTSKSTTQKNEIPKPKVKKTEQSKDMQDTEQKNEVNFNIMATSSELFSSTTETSDVKLGGATERKVVRKKTKKHEKSSSTLSVGLAKNPTDNGGFNSDDFRDFCADSSFPTSAQERISNNPINSPIVVASVSTKEENSQTTKTNVRKIKVAKKPSQGKSSKQDKSPNMDKLQKSPKMNKGSKSTTSVTETCPSNMGKRELDSQKKKSNIIVAETTPPSSEKSDRSDSSTEKQRKKKKRRLSLKKRNEQLYTLRRSSRIVTQKQP